MPQLWWQWKNPKRFFEIDLPFLQWERKPLCARKIVLALWRQGI